MFTTKTNLYDAYKMTVIQLESLIQSGQLNPGKQTSVNKDTESPNSSVLSLSGRTDRQRTAFFRKFGTVSGQRTESRQTESGQIDTGQKSRTTDRHRTLFSGKSGQKRDKGRTRKVLSADVLLVGLNFSNSMESDEFEAVITSYFRFIVLLFMSDDRECSFQNQCKTL